MTEHTPITQDSLVVVNSTKGKCPYRRMYEASILTGTVAKFQNKETLFERCSECAGFGFYFHALSGTDIECPEYPKIIEAREFVKNQVKNGGLK